MIIQQKWYYLSASYVKKPMYQPLPPYDRRPRSPGRTVPSRVRSPAHIPVTSRGQAATHLALPRNTVAAWLRYRDGGLDAL
jgi:hypothetical protein